MRRRIGLFLVTGMLLPLAMAAEASAQGATLTVIVPGATPGQASPGQVITVTGTGFNPTNAHVGGVDIRFNTRDSEPLANTNPTPQGTISAEFPLPPNVAVGEHLLIGTQVTTRGRHTFGTPGRAKLRIVAGTRGEGASAAGFPGDIPPAALAGILALIALTGTVVFCARRLRTLDRPLGS